MSEKSKREHSESRSRDRSNSRSCSRSSRSRSTSAVRRIREEAKRDAQLFVASLMGFHSQKLRFEQGDRVICRLMGRLAPGLVLQVNIRDPEDGLYVAYVVKIDRLSNALPSKTIYVSHDTDACCIRETCLPITLEKMVMFCAQQYDVLPKLRFAPGERVSFRVEDAEDGLDQWLCGVVKEAWPKLPQPCEFEGIQFGDTVPYSLEADSTSGRLEVLYYCHRDDHTLIRTEENMPQKRGIGVAKRIEKRVLASNVTVTFDHVTCRSRRIQSESESSDE